MICEIKHKIPKYGVNFSLGILYIYVYEASFLQPYLKALSQYNEVLIFMTNQSCAFHVINCLLYSRTKQCPMK